MDFSWGEEREGNIEKKGEGLREIGGISNSKP